MKYRIKEVGSYYYPQYRVCWIWFYFIGPFDEDIYFTSLERAYEYLNYKSKEEEGVKGSKKVIIHPYPKKNENICGH